MKQTIFETRQRAEELLRESINIWRQSDDNDKLEGLENDPVLKLMITALAYQTNESISELEAMKTDVLEDFAHLLTPYEVGHAVPATAVIETVLQESVPSLDVNEQSVFSLNGTDHTFLPLLKTRLLNAKIASVVRIDGRRFRCSLNFSSPVKDLSGFAFALNNLNFQDVHVSVNGQQLPLIRPWDYSGLPLLTSFDLDTILYNRSQTYEASASCLDLFARQNIRIFIVRPETYIQETDSVRMVFEFTGISDRFQFDKQQLSLNPLVIVNAQLHEVTLSAQSPIARVAGFDNAGENANSQFLHAVRPSEEQLYGNSVIEVRRVSADRFDQGRLVRLLNSVIARYHSDYYAFQNLQGLSGDKTMQTLQEILYRLMEAGKKDQQHHVSGVYLMLRDERIIQQNGSVTVSYLTTAGSAVNNMLKSDSTFTVPAGLSATQTRQIAPPVLGRDEVTEEASLASLSRYYIATGDRIVTPADIKLFCYNELLTRYGIVRNMVKSLTVNRRQQADRHGCGYEMVVEIMLASNPFIKRSFEEKLSQVEILLQKMIEVRSTNIYPIVVSILMDNKE